MRRSSKPILAALACLALLDLGLSAFAIRDGAFGFRALPPFRGTHHPWQKRWLAEQEAELAGNQRPGAMGAFDPELGWTNVAGAKTGLSAELPYSYNAIGARSTREYTPAPAPGVVRLACFGESFTQGDEVADPDTWPAQLEALDPKFEALNFGVGGYGTDQALLRMRRGGLYGAQVALMGFMTDNIGRNVNRYRPLWHPRTAACVAKPRFLLNGGRLELLPIPYANRAELIEAVASDRVIRDLREHEYWSRDSSPTWLGYSSLARLGWGWWAYRRREVPRLYVELEAEPVQTSLAVLGEFVREAQHGGAEQVLVLFFPRLEDLRLAEQNKHYWQPFLSRLAEQGVTVLDLTPALSAALKLLGEPGLFSGAHYSPRGNRVVAEELEGWLRANGR